MKSIYWNTKNISEPSRILDIAQDESPDLFFLSEVDAKLLHDNQTTLDSIGYEYYPNPGCDRVRILKRKELEAELSLQTRYYTTLFVKNVQTYVVSVHLPSQMFQHMDGLKEFIRDFRTNIDSEIGSSATKRILIIGDFNVNPYEKPMIDYDGFLATNSINSRSEMTHLGKTKSSYYNPTWQLYSRKHFPGTKYFKRPSGASYDVLEFHYLDQVVVSQYLKTGIISERIDVIEKTKKLSYFNSRDNSIEGSDHLPILYEFKLT